MGSTWIELIVDRTVETVADGVWPQWPVRAFLYLVLLLCMYVVHPTVVGESKSLNSLVITYYHALTFGIVMVWSYVLSFYKIMFQSKQTVIINSYKYNNYYQRCYWYHSATEYGITCSSFTSKHCCCWNHLPPHVVAIPNIAKASWANVNAS